MTLYKEDGFVGQQAIIIPDEVLKNHCVVDPITKCLYLTDIGYYPKALYHRRMRRQGAMQHILIFCYEGRGRATIAGVSYLINAGEYLIIPLGTPHEYWADEDDPWTIYWIHFNGDLTTALTQSFLRRINGHKGSVVFFDPIREAFEKICQHLSKGYSRDNLGFVNLGLWQLVQNILYNERLAHDTEAPSDIINRALEFLAKNTGNTLTLEAIASHVNLSPPYFTKVFKQRTGFSPIEYFNQLKMQKACQYLLFTELRIKEIALKVGISDAYYFSRLFTRIMAMNPKDYRKYKR